MNRSCALICILALRCYSCQNASASGSSVGAQPAPVPAKSVPNLEVDSEAEQRRIFPITDFAYGFEKADFSTPGGNLSNMFVNGNQVLATLPNGGVGQNLVTLAPCAINQPHVHPRGTEISHITQGKMMFGFVEENANTKGTSGGRFINATVTAGQTFFIPQGLIHFGLNLQCTPAQFIATFPTADPGTVTVSQAFFSKLPVAALRATLGLDFGTIQTIVDAVNSMTQTNPSFDPDCLASCNMTMPDFTAANTA